MSFFDKFGSKIGLTDDKDRSSAGAHSRDSEEDYMETEQDNVVDFQSVAASSAGSSVNKQMKVVIIEPASFDDVQQIADHIKARKPVVLNFENTSEDTAKRIIDFVSGATYALAGDIKKVGQHIFLCAPNNVNVTFSNTSTQRSFASSADKLPWE